MSLPRAIVGAGPRAVEDALVAELERLAPASLAALAAAPGPVRVVVPSGSLRVHLLAELARRRTAWLGVEVLTLRRLARWLYERAGEAPPRGGALLPILVAREARKESELAGPLEPLEGGYATLVATVRDLVDAGLESIHGHPLAELIADDDVRIALADRPRAAAVARVAQRTAQELERLGSAPGATLLRRAAELLAGRPELLPPGLGWIVHGFADATGSALDLLEMLARWGPTTLLLDLPESAVGTPRDAGETFGSGLRGRLLRGARGEAAPTPRRAELEAFSARGESAEAREVARRVRAELAADPELRPEAIGIVARDLHLHLPALRRALEAAALPFSVEGAGGADPARREVASLVRLLDRGADAEADLAIDLLAPGQHGAAGAAELRVALRVLGVATLADFAALEESTLPADVRLPLRNVENAEEGNGVLRAGRYPRARLAAWAAAARRLARGLEHLPEQGRAGALIRALHGLAERALPAGGAARRWLESSARELASDLPKGFWLGRDEIAELLGRAAEELPELAVGGAGGGVQVLSVTAARARTFARLYLIGLRRGAFPRAVSDDPLLPDGVRREARAVLLELPVKSEGHAEERFLFDQLLAAAPRVVLSFPALSDDGSEQLVSPLLDRLSWRDAGTRALREQWRTPIGAQSAPAAGLPPAPSDLALRAGLERRRADWAAVLPAALAEARRGAAVSADERDLARFRAALVEEIDLDPHTAGGRRRWRRLGPFFGRVGPLPEEPLFVTRVERVIACAWLDFLTRRLGLEPLPDPSVALPEPLDPVRVGTATHRLLEVLFAATLREQNLPPADWTAPDVVPAEIPFPEPERVRRQAREVARGQLADEGLARWGFESLFAEALVDRVEIARADFGSGRRVVGVELEGEADLTRHGAPIRLRFRADRVDREADRLVLTDYKTGRPKAIAELARAGKLARAIATGRSLQPAAYVAALDGRPATGRLLALGPTDDEAIARVAALDEGAAAALGALARAAAIVATARATGRLLPRLVDASGEQRGPACASCELVEACIQEDSSARGRLARWAADQRAARARRHGIDPEPPARIDGDRAEADLFLLPETELEEEPEGTP